MSKAEDEVTATIQKLGADMPDPTRPFALLVRLLFRSGDHSGMEHLFAETRALTLQEPGCIGYDISREASDPDRFVLYEQWRSLADLDAHLRTPYLVKLGKAFDANLEHAPEFTVLLPLS